MKKIKNQALVYVLIMALIISNLLFKNINNVYADTYSGNAGDNIYWSIDTESGLMSVTGNGNMAYYNQWQWTPYSTNYGNYVRKVTVQDGITSIGENAFCCFENLEEIEVPKTISKIGFYAFNWCFKLKQFIAYNVETIGGKAFFECKELQYVYFGENLIRIDDNTFAGCYSLNNVYLPKTIETVEKNAFSACNSLTDVYYGGSKEEWEQISIDYGNDDLLNANIHFGSTYEDSKVAQEKENELTNNLALKGTVTASSCENDDTVAGNAIDGDKDTRWSSEFTDDEWILLELDQVYKISDIILYWEEAYAEEYDIQVSIDGIEYDTVKNIVNQNKRKIHTQLEYINAKYIKINCIKRGTKWGYSLREFEVYSLDQEGERGEKPSEEETTIGTYDKAIAVFTTEKNLSVKTGDSIWLAFGLMDENTELLDGDWKKMAITVSDSTVISLSDYEKTEYGYSLEVIGEKAGATNITITDTDSGINTIITVNVYDTYTRSYSYDMNNIETFYPNNKWEKNIATNIYDLNGLYVNNYRCQKQGNEYEIEFDIYNSKYYTGSVDIYDADGIWMGYEEIKKYSDITSICDTGKQAFYLISDHINKRMLTYEQTSFSEHTYINIKVPEGGYFTISNNIAESPGTYFANAIEILYDGASTALDLYLSDSVKTSAFSGFKKGVKDSLTKRLIETHNEMIQKEVKKKAQKVMLNTMKSEISKISKKITQAELKGKISATEEAYSDIANLSENILNSYDISWKHLFQSATGLGESFFEELSGPAGVALKGCFAITKSSNKLLMATQMAASCDNTYAMVYSSLGDEYINPQGVYVTTNGNVDSEAILQVFRVSNDDVVEVVLNSNNPLEKHELYNISFVKNDKLVQPNGRVTVHIPVPDGMRGDTCKIYRQENDETWTILDAHIEGNYLVFETDHFSLYAVIGETAGFKVSSLPNKSSYVEGDILETDGMIVELNGEQILEGYICEPTILSQVGIQTITVKYGLSETKFDVVVKPASEISTTEPCTNTNPVETSKVTEIRTTNNTETTSETFTTKVTETTTEKSADNVAVITKAPTSTVGNQEKKESVIANNKVTKIKKIKRAKKSLKVTWKKVSGVSGYQIQYSASSKFKKAKKITIKKATTTSKTMKKLKAKKKYYVRIRTYIMVNGKKKYSNWSKKKSQKTK